MRPAARLALAAATAAAVSLSLVVSVTGIATATPAPPAVPSPGATGMPSQAQVDRAKAAVADKKQSVSQLEGALAAATARMEAASTAAETAAESYNGAMWRLSVARKAYRQAKTQEKRARLAVAAQRSGIVTLVTDSYQNGTELNTATALMSDEGPTGLMNRYGVVASAGDSMRADYDAFRIASAKTQQFSSRTAAAQKQQVQLTAEAKHLALVAGHAASAAGAAANQIAAQKQQLVRALAKAENISVALATQRHDALERIAREKAAAAARAQAAEQAALQLAAQQAQHQANASTPHHQNSGGSTSGAGVSVLPPPSSAPPVVANPAPNRSVAVQRAIDYAKAQLGKPYQWAGAGPDTFDCSGLTMQAWARGGKTLGHYTGAQFAESTPISMADARPGDLLFFSSNGSPSGIHHVALYLGGGSFIEAPHTGANVRYNSIYNWYPDFVGRP